MAINRVATQVATHQMNWDIKRTRQLGLLGVGKCYAEGQGRWGLYVFQRRGGLQRSCQQSVILRQVVGSCIQNRAKREIGRAAGGRYALTCTFFLFFNESLRESCGSDKMSSG